MRKKEYLKESAQKGKGGEKMKLLVTGAKGFIGRNLIENLKNIRDGKNSTRPDLSIEEIFEYDMDTNPALLDFFCQNCDFVFHLAGVNRPKEPKEFMEGNFGFTSHLLDTLEKYQNKCPVMLASSIQAELTGRYKDSDYGKSKLAGEELLLQYKARTGSPVLIYRFPNLFGKWCRPNYNSVVATFCNAIANGLEYTINDPHTELELVYIDDLVEELFNALEEKEHKKGDFCYVPTSCFATLGEIAERIQSFSSRFSPIFLPEIPDHSFEKKLYSTYLSYLPESKISCDLHAKEDERGSFTELFRTDSCGQISVNVTKPGKTKGHHWHNSKWEIFIVVSGHGRILERKLGINPETGTPYPVTEFEVSGKEMRAVYMLPGHTHSITNLSKTQDLVTIMWANETFDLENPDTFYEKVE